MAKKMVNDDLKWSFMMVNLRVVFLSDFFGLVNFRFVLGYPSLREVSKICDGSGARSKT